MMAPHVLIRLALLIHDLIPNPTPQHIPSPHLNQISSSQIFVEKAISSYGYRRRNRASYGLLLRRLQIDIQEAIAV